MDDKQQGKLITLPWVEPDPGKTWLPKKPVAPGEWEPWIFDLTKGWTLKLLPLFAAQIRQRDDFKPYGGTGRCRVFEFEINGHFIIGNRPTLEEAQRAVEQHIVTLMRQALPGYRIIHARVAAPPRKGPQLAAVPPNRRSAS